MFLYCNDVDESGPPVTAAGPQGPETLSGTRVAETIFGVMLGHRSPSAVLTLALAAPQEPGHAGPRRPRVITPPALKNVSFALGGGEGASSTRPRALTPPSTDPGCVFPATHTHAHTRRGCTRTPPRVASGWGQRARDSEPGKEGTHVYSETAGRRPVLNPRLGQPPLAAGSGFQQEPTRADSDQRF